MVHHLKFTHWPDHGVPHSSDQLVRFIRYMRAVHSRGPVTVHCSAGIGRAGVLICTDVILGLVRRDLPVSGSRSGSDETAASRPILKLVDKVVIYGRRYDLGDLSSTAAAARLH